MADNHDRQQHRRRWTARGSTADQPRPVGGRDEEAGLDERCQAEPGGDTFDMSALRADDALLDSLGSGATEDSGQLSPDQIDSLLLSWRREIDSEPIGELVDTETAATVIRDARERRNRNRRQRFLVPLASAAAVLLIAFTVVGFAARSAQPGDTLWAVTQVLYSDHAKSVQAAADARQDLDQARVQLTGGRPAEARDLLTKVDTSLRQVHDEDGRKQLLQRRDALLAELRRTGGQQSGGQHRPGQQPPPPVQAAGNGQHGSGAASHQPAPASSTSTTPSTPSSSSPSPSNTPTPKPPDQTSRSTGGSHVPSSSDDQARPRSVDGSGTQAPGSRLPQGSMPTS